MRVWRSLIMIVLLVGAGPGQLAFARPPESLLLTAGELGISRLSVRQVEEQGLLLTGTNDRDNEPGAVDESRAFVSNLAAREAAIDALIRDRGAYGDGLDEAYGEFGKLQFENGNYQQAAQLFRQAWHLSRVNSGLYSERQLAYLNSLINSLVELQQWDEVHDLHQLSFLIASRVYEPDDQRFLIAAQLFASWKWEAISGNFLSGGYRRAFELALQLSAFYAEVIDKVEHADGPNAEGLARLVADKARTDISIARALVSSSSARSALGNGSYIPETRCFDTDMNSGPARRCRQVQLAVYELDDSPAYSMHFALGRYLKQVQQSTEHLERIQASAENLNAAEKEWIASLIGSLRKESEALSSPALRF